MSDGPQGVPPSLLEGDLPRFWDDVGERLERNGERWRGRMLLSPYSSTARNILISMTGGTARRSVELTALEHELARLGVGADLPTALAALGRPVSPEPAAQRAERARQAEGRATARALAAEWPEPWAADWVEELIGAGILARHGGDEAIELLQQVRRVLDAIDTLERGSGGGGAGSATFSRTELAATVLGSAHALDDGTLVERATARALLHRRTEAAAGVDPWATIGAHRSLLAGAVLTWRLPLVADHPLAPVVERCTDLGLPFVVTRLAIDTVGIAGVAGSDVLVVENPRVIEHAAQRRTTRSVVCANGNPSTTVLALLDRLGSSGVTLRYHGDFDRAGLEICTRMHTRGLIPWRMSAGDYLDALAAADQAGVSLPSDPRACGPTPWDLELATAFNHHRRIVHEERLLDRIIDDHE